MRQRIELANSPCGIQRLQWLRPNLSDDPEGCIVVEPEWVVWCGSGAAGPEPAVHNSRGMGAAGRSLPGRGLV